MTAWVEIAEAYSLVMRAERKLCEARKALTDAPGYGDPKERDLDGCWNKVNGAADELRDLIAEGRP